MTFFRAVSFAEPALSVTGEGVSLRLPQMSDFEEWAALREASRSFLVPWEPIWPADDLTRTAFRRRLRRYTEDQRNDLAYPYFIFRNEDQKLVGGLTLTNIRRGVAQAGSLGYWMGAAYARQGYMTAAVRTLVPFAFSTRFRAAVGEDRLCPRGLCAGIPVHQRHLAGSPALRPGSPGRACSRPLLTIQKAALGLPRFACYKLAETGGLRGSGICVALNWGEPSVAVVRFLPR
jgi:ribosomal-protein-alanine N-acetyltransferase